VSQGKIKDYQEQLNQAGEKAKAEYIKAMAQMQEKADEARKLFEHSQSATESAWKDMYAANQKAFAELQKGWAEALSHFGATKK